MANATTINFDHTYAGEEFLEILLTGFYQRDHEIAVTTYNNVKYKMNLYDSDGFTDVLKRGNAEGFTTSGGITVNDKTLEVKEIKSEGEQGWTAFSTNAWSAVLGNGVGRADLSTTPLADFLTSEFAKKTVDNMISCDWFGVYASGVDIYGSYDGLFLDMLYNGNGGTITKTTISGYTSASTLDGLTADAAIDTILPKMYYNADRTLRQKKAEGGLQYLVTPSIYENYKTSLRGRGTNLGDEMIINGARQLTFDGIPVVEKLDWERDLANADNPLKTTINVSGAHLALLTTQRNLAVGTDFSLDTTSFQSWYNIDEQKLRMRTQTVRGTKVANPKMISLAYYY